MKKNISINLQGIIFHIEDDGYESLSRYLQEVKAHFASYQGHEEIVADIEGRIAELFTARLSPAKQVITLADVQDMTAKMGRVSDFNTSPDEDEDEPTYANTGAGSASQSAGFGQPGTPPPAGGPAAAAADGQPRRLYRDLAHRKIAGVCAGLAQYFMVNPLVVRLIFLALLLLPNLLGGFDHFPGTNFFRHQFDFSGLALIAYVVLWIALPKRYDAPEPIDTLSSTGPLAGRKLYRDTNAGKVGGVSAGLAAYFNVDVTLIRVLFLATTLVGGSGLIVYLVLWVVVPEAKTVSEKMQMRGDAVTLSGIDNNLRNAETDGPTGPNRPVGAFFENAAREARPAFSFVGSLIRWTAGALLVFMGGSFLLSVLTLAGAALGIISNTSVIRTNDGFRFGDEGLNSVLRNAQPWGVVMITLALGIPALALLLLGVRLIVRRSVLGRSGGLILLAFWLLGVVGSVAAGVQIAQNYQTRANYTSTRKLAAVPGPGIVLASRNLDDFIDDGLHLRLALADSGAAPFVEEDYRARGRTQSAARLTAQQSILYNIAQQDSTITFDQGITLRENAPYRAQQLTLTLHLPLDKIYSLTPLFLEKLSDRDFTSGHRPDTDQPHRARFTREAKFTCLDCPASDDDDGDNAANEGDNDDEVVKLDVNGNRMRVRVNTDGDSPRVSVETDAASFNTEPGHYGSGRKTLSDPGDFTRVEAHGALRVVVRPGSAYKVEAAGRPDDLRQLRLTRDGDRVVLRQGSSEFNLFELGDHGSNEILVTVTLPYLSELSLNGACQADISGFTQQQDLHLEANGASVLRVAAEVPALSLDLNGASRADLTGHAERFDLEGHGASQIQALGLSANRVKATLHSASQASVRATEDLSVDLSGGSQMKYAGEPHIEQNLSSGSSLEQVRD